jgi:hypothetical protein
VASVVPCLFLLSSSLLGAVRLGRLFSRGFRSVSGGWLTVVRVRLPCVGGIRVLLLGGGDTTLLVLVLVLRMVPGALSLCSFTSDWVVLLLWLFSFFLVMFVCSFGFWLPGLFFRSVEICRDQFFQFCIHEAREVGKADSSG